jgi:hypothetical protein
VGLGFEPQRNHYIQGSGDWNFIQISVLFVSIHAFKNHLLVVEICIWMLHFTINALESEVYVLFFESFFLLQVQEKVLKKHRKSDSHAFQGLL